MKVIKINSSFNDMNDLILNIEEVEYINFKNVTTAYTKLITSDGVKRIIIFKIRN